MPPVLTADPRPASPGAVHGRPTSGVQFRRALVLMLMTLVLPGSAQLVAGRKEVGRIALRIWLGLIVHRCSCSSGSGWCSARSSSGCSPTPSCWAWCGIVLMRDGGRLGLAVRRRLAARRAAGAAAEAAPGDGRHQRRALLLASPGRLLFASHVVGRAEGLHQRDVHRRPRHRRHTTAATTCCCSAATPAPDRWGLRPDSLTVASIDAEHRQDGAVRAAAQHAELPVRQGLDHGTSSSRTATTAATQLRAELAVHLGRATTRRCSRASTNPGVEATIEAVEGITGLKINYYAMVNLQGFRKLVDAVGGVTLNVRDRIPIGGVGGRRHRLHRARQAQAQRLRDAVVRPVARQPPTTTRGWPGRSA